MYCKIAMFLQRIDSQHARTNKKRTFFYCRTFDDKIRQNTTTYEMAHELKREKVVMADKEMPYSTANVGQVIVEPSTTALLLQTVN